MKTIQAKLLVVEGDRTITQTAKVDGKQVGKPLQIKSPGKAKFVLIDEETGFAPEGVRITRVGDDLHLALDGAADGKTSIVIENFYGDTNLLIGQAENGAYYNYVPTDGQQAHFFAVLADGSHAAQALGGGELAGVGQFVEGGAAASAAAAGAAGGAAAGFGSLGMLGALALLGGAVGVGGLVSRGGKSGGQPSAASGSAEQQTSGQAGQGQASGGQGAGSGGTSDPNAGGQGTAGGGAGGQGTGGANSGSQTAGGSGSGGAGTGGQAAGSSGSGSGGSTGAGTGGQGSGGGTSGGTGSGGAGTGAQGSGGGASGSGGSSGAGTGGQGSGGGTGSGGATGAGTGGASGSGSGTGGGTGSGGSTGGSTGGGGGSGSGTGGSGDQGSGGGTGSGGATGGGSGSGSGSGTGGSGDQGTGGGTGSGGATGGGTGSGSGSGTGGSGDQGTGGGTGSGGATGGGSGSGSGSGTGGSGDQGTGGGTGSGGSTGGGTGSGSGSGTGGSGDQGTGGGTGSGGSTGGGTGSGSGSGTGGSGDQGTGGGTGSGGSTGGGTGSGSGSGTGGSGDQGTGGGTGSGGSTGGGTGDGSGSGTGTGGSGDPGTGGGTGSGGATGGGSGSGTGGTGTPDTAQAPKPQIGGATGKDIQGQDKPIESGGATQDPRPVISGSGEPGSTVAIYDNGKKIGETKVDDKGGWTWRPESDLPGGEHKITTTQTTPGGSTSDPSDPVSFVTDTDTPPAPVITSVIDDEGAKTGPIGKGTITDDRTPEIGGTAKAGTLVEIRDAAGKVLASAVVKPDGSWSAKITDAHALSDGPQSLTAHAVNVAGKQSASAPFDFTVDSSTPPQPEITGITGTDILGHKAPIEPGSTTNDPQPTVSGHGKPGDTVTVYDNGVPVGSAVVDGKGDWSVTLPKLTGNDHLITAQETGPNGKVGPVSDRFDFHSDTAPPPAPRIVDAFDDLGPKQGAVGSGEATDDSTPLIRGTGKPGTMVRLFKGDEALGSAVVDEHGNWSVAVADGVLKEGHQNLTAVASNVGGDQATSQPFDFWLQKTAPGGAKIDSIEASDAGNIHTDGAGEYYTTDIRPLIKGKVIDSPGATEVVIYERFAGGVRKIMSTTVNEDGSFAAKVPEGFLIGHHEIYAIPYNSAGVPGHAQNFKTLHIDPQAKPQNPTITAVVDHVPAGQLEHVDRDGTTNDSKPTLVGTAQPGQHLRIYNGDKLLGEITVADSKGVWQFTPFGPLPDGNAELRVVATNTTPPLSSETYRFTIDTKAPDPATDIRVTSDTGAQTGEVPEGGKTGDARPQVSGSAEPLSTVRVIVDGQVVGSAKVDANGKWTAELSKPLPAGEHTMTTTVTDAAGNTSAPSPERHFTVDNSVPVQIGRVLDDQAPHTGAIEPGSATNDTTPTVEGTSLPNSLVTIYDGTRPIASGLADVHGAWSITVPASAKLADGAHTLSAKVTGPGGQVLGDSGAFPIKVDTVAPKPVIGEIRDGAGQVRGPIAENGISDDPQPTLRGTGEPGDRVALVDDKGNILAETTVRADGSWTLVPNVPLADGPHALQVVETDAAGNQGASQVIHFRTDTSAPVKPTIDKLIDDQGAKQGDIAPDGKTDDTRPEIRGKGKPGDTIEVRDGDTLLGKATVGPDGGWAFTPTVDLSGGHHNLVAKAISPTGNVTESNPFGFTLAPDVPVARASIDSMTKDTGEGGDFATASGDSGRLVQGKLSEALQAGEKVMVSFNGGRDFVQAQVVGNQWFTRDPGAHDSGWQIQTKVVNAAGVDGPLSTRDVKLVGGVGAPTVTGIDEMSDGHYTPEEAAQGATARISLDGTGAHAGDVLHIVWGNTTYDYALTAADISAGAAAVKIPATTTQAQGASEPFKVSAQLVTADGAASASSKGVTVAPDLIQKIQFENAMKVAHVTESRDPSGPNYIDYQVTKWDFGNGMTLVGTKSKSNGLVASGWDNYYETVKLRPYNGQPPAIVKFDESMGGIQKIKLNINFLYGSVPLDSSSRLEFAVQQTDSQGKTVNSTVVIHYNRDGSSYWTQQSDPLAAPVSVSVNAPSKLNGWEGSISFNSQAPITGMSFYNVSPTHAEVKAINIVDATRDLSKVDFQSDDTIDHLWESYTGTAGTDKIKIKVDPSEYLKQKSAKIVGGEGIDTLVLTGENQTLDLTILRRGGEHGRIDSVERFDLRGHGAGKIVVGADNVAHLGKVDAFHANGRTQIMVEGDGDDAVNLAGVSGVEGGGVWRNAGTVTLADPDTGAATEYVSYQFSTLAFEVLVRKGVPVSGDIAMASPMRKMAAPEVVDEDPAPTDTQPQDSANPSSTATVEPPPAHIESASGLPKLIIDGANLKFDFAKLAQVEDTPVNTIDLAQGGGNTLVLRAEDVLTRSSDDVMRILGDDTDTVVLQGAVAGTPEDGFVPYTLGNATLLIDEHINVII